MYIDTHIVYHSYTSTCIHSFLPRHTTVKFIFTSLTTKLLFTSFLRKFNFLYMYSIEIPNVF